MNEQELIDQIKSVTPLMEANASDAEHQRKPVDAVMKAIEETDAYRYFVPKRFGGFEFGLEGFMEIGMAMGEADLSTAWVVTFCMEHNWLLSLYNRRVQEEIFTKQPYIIAPGTLAPTGTATPTEGGHVVKGRWQWGTGVMHADWVMVGALTPVESSEKARLCMYLLPRNQVEVIDTWRISGMAGTGSNDIAVENIFVPSHYSQDLEQVRVGNSPGAAWHQTPIYKIPMMPMLGLTATAPAVGCARKALSLFQQRLQERVLLGSQQKQGGNPIAQHRLGRLTNRMENIEALLMLTAREVEGWGSSGEICPEAERIRLRLRIAEIVRSSRDVVRDVVEESGAHAHFLDCPLQRSLRDMETLSCHTVFDVDVAGEQYGRALLGMPATVPV